MASRLGTDVVRRSKPLSNLSADKRKIFQASTLVPQYWRSYEKRLLHPVIERGSFDSILGSGGYCTTVSSSTEYPSFP